jgi:hypothetical protein
MIIKAFSKVKNGLRINCIETLAHQCRDTQLLREMGSVWIPFPSKSTIRLTRRLRPEKKIYTPNGVSLEEIEELPLCKCK